jgi:hypothetical protein
MDQVDKKNDFQGVATFCSERPVETEINSLQEPLKAQPQEIKRPVSGTAGLLDTDITNNSRGRPRRDILKPLLAQPKEMQEHPRLGRTVRPRQLNIQGLTQGHPTHLRII